MPTATDLPLAPDVARRLRALADRWADAGAAERANYALYLVELCDALGVERPRPAAAARAGDGEAYQFEYPVRTTTRDGVTTTNFIDLYKAGCFALEAKDAAEGASTTRLLTAAFGQVSNYAKDLAERPPYVMVLDVGKSLVVWDRWSGTYGGFHLGHRIDLRTLADRPADVALLRDAWTDPSVRDPRRFAQAITVEIAGLLGELAATLEGRGHDPERVARFLIRCVFTMFAEDVHLLPDTSFKRLIDAVLPRGPEAFVQAAEGLWRAMNDGALFGYHQLLRFNGHFFASAEALPLERAELELLRRAADADWASVEPTIFGTLLVRALTPEERHRLGAEYTPRAFIERLVRPTVEEPVRERWAAVQAEVLQLRDRGRPADVRAAEARLVEFHGWLRGLRVLDPACGSGNFLYVTMHALKRVEVEVFRLLADLHGGQLGVRLDEIDPGQFHGIEVKAWAREIAELTLWIGFHQFWRQQHGDVQPREPLLRDTGTLEQRDAVLAWDEIRRVPERDRPDPTPRLVHPVTGKLVPDPEARLPYYEYVNARPAEWPEAEFIVGNPPYLGEKRQREVLGDGYVEAVRHSYPDVPESADYVMYWWYRAAERVASGRTVRAGLITTNSITQAKNREVIEWAAARHARVTWAIPDHVWYDGADGAEVRVAMTVLARDPSSAELVHVQKVDRVEGDVGIVSTFRVDRLNADLSAHADVAGASRVPLLANRGLASQGFKRGGDGFLLDEAEVERITLGDPSAAALIRPYWNGKDVTERPSNRFVIDFGLRDEAEARRYAMLFDRVRTRVMPERAASARASYAQFWWRFMEPRRELRSALTGLHAYFATPEVSKHLVVVRLPSEAAPDGALVCFALDDVFALGVLSSSAHTSWAHAAGGRMGVRHTPRYSKTLCFDAFPFPDPAPNLRTKIADAAERLDAHRKAAIARDERVTMTGMYNVVEKLRSGEPLTAKERAVHELAACGVLRDLHDELDALVAEAYGWPWPMPDDEILDRLVALHDERVAEEARGVIRWLRPEYQAPRAGDAVVAAPLDLPDADAAPAASAAPAPVPWPAEAIEQISALKRLAAVAPVTVDDATAHFLGARRDLVERHLGTLAILGEVRLDDEKRYGAPATL